MTKHVHLTPLHAVATILLVVAVLGTLHLWALSNEDSRVARALFALGF